MVIYKGLENKMLGNQNRTGFENAGVVMKCMLDKILYIAIAKRTERNTFHAIIVINSHEPLA